MMENGTKSSTSYRILIVDDDEEILNLIKITLEGAKDIDAEVVAESDPESALELLKSQEFNVVLSDYRMKAVSGVELLSQVRENYPETKRVLITAYSELDLAKEAINRAKVDLYIEKPWTKDQIRKDVKDLLTGIGSPEKEEIDIEDGSAYLFKERKPKVLYQIGLERINSIGEGLIITRQHPKKADQTFEVEGSDVDIYWLSKMSGDKTLDPVNLELIADLIIRYYEEGGKTVILDGIDSLLRDNSFKRFEGFLDNIVDIVGIEDGAFLTGLDPRIVPEQKLATMERKMVALSFESE